MSRIMLHTMLAIVIVATVVASDSELGSPSLVMAQGGIDDCYGGDPPNACIIWGVSPGPATSTVHSINVCNGAVTNYGPFPFPMIQTAAARAPSSLFLGDVGGMLYQYPLPNGPPAAVGALTPAATALSEGEKPGMANLYAGSDLPAAACLYGPLAPIGCDISGDTYSTPEGDLVFNHAAQTPFPLTGSVSVVGAGLLWEHVDVSRATGLLPFPHYLWAPNVPVDGLAFDGFGRLWASALGTLYLATPSGAARGALAPTSPIPPTIKDLATTPQCITEAEELGDLGDAPDSTNHPAKVMTAYAGVNAGFPTVFDVATGSPEGPIHVVVGADSWLGVGVTEEKDADLLPDADGITNIDPLLDVKDRDGQDDGVSFPISLPQCQQTQFQYTVNVVGPTRTRYVNAWIDFNHDGDWADTLTCTDGGGQPRSVPEWVVQDQVTNLAAGVHVVATPPIWSVDLDDDVWLRITLAEGPTPGTDGRGPSDPYEIGETEDYLLHNVTADEYQP